MPTPASWTDRAKVHLEEERSLPMTRPFGELPAKAAPVAQPAPLDEERFTDDAGSSHTADQCRWRPSAIYPGHDVCLTNPVAHYREQAAADSQPSTSEEER